MDRWYGSVRDSMDRWVGVRVIRYRGTRVARNAGLVLRGSVRVVRTLGWCCAV